MPVSVRSGDKIREVLLTFFDLELPFVMFLDPGKLVGWGGPDLGSSPLTLAFNETTYRQISGSLSGTFSPESDRLVVTLSFDRVYDCAIPYPAIFQISILPTVEPVEKMPGLRLIHGGGEA